MERASKFMKELTFSFTKMFSQCFICLFMIAIKTDDVCIQTKWYRRC